MVPPTAPNNPPLMDVGGVSILLISKICHNALIKTKVCV